MSRHTKQFSTKTMQVYRYHGDTDETPTVDAGNLSVQWMVGAPAASVVLAGARCLAEFPSISATEGCTQAYLGALAVQQAQTSRGLTPIASEID